MDESEARVRQGRVQRVWSTDNRTSSLSLGEAVSTSGGNWTSAKLRLGRLAELSGAQFGVSHELLVFRSIRVPVAAPHPAARDAWQPTLGATVDS